MWHEQRVKAELKGNFLIIRSFWDAYFVSNWKVEKKLKYGKSDDANEYLFLLFIHVSSRRLNFKVKK